MPKPRSAESARTGALGLPTGVWLWGKLCLVPGADHEPTLGVGGDEGLELRAGERLGGVVRRIDDGIEVSVDLLDRDVVAGHLLRVGVGGDGVEVAVGEDGVAVAQ